MGGHGLTVATRQESDGYFGPCCAFTDRLLRVATHSRRVLSLVQTRGLHHITLLEQFSDPSIYYKTFKSRRFSNVIRSCLGLSHRGAHSWEEHRTYLFLLRARSTLISLSFSGNLSFFKPCSRNPRKPGQEVGSTSLYSTINNPFSVNSLFTILSTRVLWTLLTRLISLEENPASRT